MRTLILSAMLSAAALPVLGHDMWIEPAAFFPGMGQIVSLRLRVGQELIGDPLQRNSSLINQFIVADVAGRRPVVGRDGGDPAGFIRVAAPGLLTVGYFSNPSSVELNAETFNTYLKEEGLDSIAALRASRKETGAPVRELFSRCAKTLLLSGLPSPSQADRTLGFRLELTAERNPYLLRDGEELPLRLTYENKPLAGTLVVAINRANPTARIAQRTGKDGRVRLRLPRGGMWLVKAVHMIPAPAGSNANWESFWASLTFEAAPEPAQTN